MTTLLVPVDLSDVSKPVLEKTTELAQQLSARVVVLHVAEPVSTCSGRSHRGSRYSQSLACGHDGRLFSYVFAFVVFVVSHLRPWELRWKLSLTPALLSMTFSN